jgi:hypothetical protein
MTGTGPTEIKTCYAQICLLPIACAIVHPASPHMDAVIKAFKQACGTDTVHMQRRRLIQSVQTAQMRGAAAPSAATVRHLLSASTVSSCI